MRDGSTSWFACCMVAIIEWWWGMGPHHGLPAVWWPSLSGDEGWVHIMVCLLCGGHHWVVMSDMQHDDSIKVMTESVTWWSYCSVMTCTWQLHSLPDAFMVHTMVKNGIKQPPEDNEQPVTMWCLVRVQPAEHNLWQVALMVTACIKQPAAADTGIHK